MRLGFLEGHLWTSGSCACQERFATFQHPNGPLLTRNSRADGRTNASGPSHSLHPIAVGSLLRPGLRGLRGSGPVQSLNGERAVAGEGRWDYAETGVHDLNGNGNKELIVLTAKGFVDENGELRGTGNQWQLYIRDLSGERTYVYANYLRGYTDLNADVSKGRNGNPSILLWKHLHGMSLAVYEILYEGPGEFTALKWGERFLRQRGVVKASKLGGAPSFSTEKGGLREAMEVWRKRQQEKSKSPDDTTGSSSQRESKEGSEG